MFRRAIGFVNSSIAISIPQAVSEGATHVLVLRTRPDGVNVVKKQSVFERLIAHRFFRCPLTPTALATVLRAFPPLSLGARARTHGSPRHAPEGYARPLLAGER